MPARGASAARRPGPLLGQRRRGDLDPHPVPAHLFATLASLLSLGGCAVAARPTSRPSPPEFRPTHADERAPVAHWISWTRTCAVLAPAPRCPVRALAQLGAHRHHNRAGVQQRQLDEPNDEHDESVDRQRLPEPDLPGRRGAPDFLLAGFSEMIRVSTDWAARQAWDHMGGTATMKRMKARCGVTDDRHPGLGLELDRHVRPR